MVYRYSAKSEWGELFGLEPQDLDIKQLEKISFEKLIEISPKDSRVEKIVANRLMEADIFDIRCIEKLTFEELKGMPYLVHKYNECLKVRGDILAEKAKSNYSHNRGSFIFWQALDSNNKLVEIARWVDNRPSVVNLRSIDFKWLYSTNKWRMREVINKVLKSNSDSDKIFLIQNLPEEQYIQSIEQISFNCNSNVFMHALSNSYTPEKYVIEILKSIAGRKKIPKLNVTLNKSILNSLPAVTRLKVLETLFIHMRGGKVTFLDIHSKEDLANLLFSVAIKYNQRVQRVMMFAPIN